VIFIKRQSQQIRECMFYQTSTLYYPHNFFIHTTFYTMYLCTVTVHLKINRTTFDQVILVSRVKSTMMFLLITFVLNNQSNE